MPLIYETTGRAREFAELAANLYTGCAHECVYCYVPAALKANRETWTDARLKENWKGRFLTDCAKLQARGETRPVLMSFACDPYQPLDAETGATREAIQMLLYHDLRVNILTKAGDRARRDFDLLALVPGNSFGSTLTFVAPAVSAEWEPGAPDPYKRMSAIHEAHDMGIETWVSLEPIINLEETLEVIMWTREYVDLYRVGKLNYHPLAREIDWAHVARVVKHELDHAGARYYMKKDLAAFIGFPEGINMLGEGEAHDQHRAGVGSSPKDV